MENYDFIVLGAGGTGLAAAMYGARFGLKTLVLGTAHGSELPIGGIITTADVVENYPGFIRVTGEEIAKKIEEHTRSCDLVDIKEERAIEVKKKKNSFIIKTEKSGYKAKTILFATGTKYKKMNVPGSDEFENKGVHYCAICDSLVFKDKVVAIVGDSDAAVKDAMILAEHAKKIYIINREKQMSAEPINLKKIKQNKKVEIINNASVIEIKGKGFVKSIVFDKKYNGINELNIDGVFIAIGHIPLSDLAKKIGVKLNEEGEIIIDHKTSSTSVKGAFAAGDVSDKQFKQLITGVADGCTAAHSAYEYIIKNSGGKQNGRTL